MRCHKCRRNRDLHTTASLHSGNVFVTNADEFVICRAASVADGKERQARVREERLRREGAAAEAARAAAWLEVLWAGTATEALAQVLFAVILLCPSATSLYCSGVLL
jgi:hypothetical protein